MARRNHQRKKLLRKKVKKAILSHYTFFDIDFKAKLADALEVSIDAITHSKPPPEAGPKPDALRLGSGRAGALELVGF